MSKNSDGYILITTLLLLLVLTIVGLSAIGTSTVENALSGNTRLRERNLTKAEAGADISTAIIEHSLLYKDIAGYANIVNDATLPNELSVVAFDPDQPDTNPDVSFNVDTGPATVDIDKMMVSWMFGSSIQFASGYEGVGKGGGSGFYSYQRVNATGSGLAGSEAEVGKIYRYVPK